MNVRHFFLAFLANVTNDEIVGFIGIFDQVYQRRKFWFLVVFLSIFTNGETFVFYWHFCPRLATVMVLVILATVSFIGHFGYEYQW